MPVMDEINAIWLKSHLGTERGLQAKLSRETGIGPDKISKILAGDRQVKSHEAPLIHGFFYPKDQPQRLPVGDALLRIWPELLPENIETLRTVGEAMIAAQDQKPSKSD